MAGMVLLIDDEEGLRKLMGRIISLEGFQVVEAADLTQARQALQKNSIDIVLCDVRLPDGNGVDFVREIKRESSLIEVILLTAYGNIGDGVQAIKNGAFDYLTKGNDNARVVPLLLQAFDKVSKNKASAVKVNTAGPLPEKVIIGESPLIATARRLAEKIAPSDTTVLLLGETGTGKEIFAGTIHRLSKRSTQPFVAVNCSAFTRELLEGELFGYKAGAFTGAQKDKKGLFELANGGTLFLDEIGELHLELQAKLLRVLENSEFIKLGDTRATYVNVRIIAATNSDLTAEVKAGHFRSDLYYRINVFAIELPPLRERIEDLHLLIQYFLDQYSTKEQMSRVTIHPDALRLMSSYSWPGNIRELRNVLQRALILLDDHILTPEHLPYELQKTGHTSPNLTLSQVEKAHIQKVLAYTKGNKTKTAELLDIGLSTLYRKIEEYHITAFQ